MIDPPRKTVKEWGYNGKFTVTSKDYRLALGCNPKAINAPIITFLGDSWMIWYFTKHIPQKEKSLPTFLSVISLFLYIIPLLDT